MNEQEWNDLRARMSARILAAIAFGRHTEVAYLTPGDRAYVERDLTEYFDSMQLAATEAAAPTPAPDPAADELRELEQAIAKAEHAPASEPAS